MGNEPQLTLWGELFVLHNSTRRREMLVGWGGGGDEAFAVGGGRLRVWVGVVPFSHHVHERASGRGPVVSLALQSSKRGLSVRELVAQLVARSTERPLVYEALGRRGIARRSAALADEKLTLAVAPAVFPERAVPAISHADPGVVELSYDVCLDPANALDGPELVKTALSFGLSGLLK